MNMPRGARRLAAVMLLALAPAAWAGAGLMTTVVTPLQTNVTYSTAAVGSTPALATYLGYRVTVANDPSNTNTINNIRFTGATAATDGAEVAAFASAEGIACSTSAGGTAIDCAIGTLRAGQSISFAVFFTSPLKVTNGVADADGQDAVAFSGITYYAEGTGGINSVPQNSTVAFAAAPVQLGTNSPTLVRSAVQKSGGQLFTGGAVATAADPWTTTVSVPATATYTTAELAESISPIPLAPNLLNQSSTVLTIPGSFAKLVITLRRDASTIVKGAKIGSAVLYYAKLATDVPFAVPACTDTSYGTLPQPGIPCVAQRAEYTKKTSPTPEWEGDWEFVVYALDNGRYTN